jgi:REP element-mobilizing transposase RayT
LFTEPAFQLFRQIVQEGRAKFSLSLYNYCLMTNHVHLFFEVPREDTLSKTMHWIGNTFSRRFNKGTGRHGHLWEGRFRSTIVEHESYFSRCMAYVDLNPVRAGIAATPLDYKWCGHRALRDEDHQELDFHPLYLKAERNAASRYASYMGLLAEECARPALSLATEYFVGTRRFVSRMVKRFSLDIRQSVKYKYLDSGLVCAGPRIGGQYRVNAS